MTEPLLLRHDDGAVTTLTLNLPERLNPLSEAMLETLQETLDEIAANRGVRVVILAARGRAFCAGHDLKEMTAGRQAEDGGRAYFEELFTRCSKVMMTITKMPQTVIARVQGIATAAGCQLVAHCDLAVAGESARFGVNGVNIGLFCSTPMVALSRNIGRKKAFELLTTGEMIGAGRAEALGLVNRVVADDALEAETAALAEKIAGKLGRALAIGKEAFHAQLDMGMADAYTYAGRVMAENMLYSETEESISAFLEKREPRWEQ